ncbi:alpha/beta fold hydrolase [Amycolatopsis suaedae]|uniref:Alpha/beta fold hydrolase n=1 Tax=Amycolatopsis suaedae TaxID=2510978 RepID=A0A4Q7J768_9PSEU|nr:alpha/beta fold hydrolase [Amycolatopsis suaedae]RZQ62999.1 alpha/beta fold hydrolase [Amycolatopsis suaedae]
MSRQLLPRDRRTRLVALVLVAAVVIAGGAVFWLNTGEEPSPVRTQDATVSVPAAPNSPDQVQLDTTVFIPENTPAPAVLMPHGFGGSKNSVASDARELAERGFVVLTYSARGFGRSTGQIGLNDPRFEVADAQALLSELARRPDVRTDGPDDPRVGVTGGSYGGALSLLLAGIDKRVDTIAPVITYNDLAQGLLPNSAAPTVATTGTPAQGAFAPDGVFKRSWAGIFFSAGMGPAGLGGSGDPGRDAPEAGQEDDGDNLGGQAGAAGGAGADAAAALGSAPPAGPGMPGNGAANPCGRFTEQVCRAYQDVATDGRASPETLALLRSVSPVSVTDRITVPTMIVQGERDTLFGLDQSDATARQIAAAGGKVKTVWYAGGHDGGKPGPRLRGQIADWLSFHLTGTGTDPGTGFAYDVQGNLRANGTPSIRTVEAPSYPGLTGDPAQRTQLPLNGGDQQVVNPPGGNPAAVSGIPGANALAAGSSRLAGLFTLDPPGQSARFTTAPVESQVLVTGGSTVRLRVSAPGGTGPEGAVLFAKLYDVSQDGTRTLPANAVAPVRLPSLPPDGSPVEVTVTLPGIVRPIDPGHALQLVVSTTDQAYAGTVQPATYRIALADGAGLAVPVVPGQAVSTGWPSGQLIGIGVTLLVAVAVAVVATIRRRRSDQVDPALAGTPLVIDNLTKAYPGGVTAVKNLSFRVEPGQVLGLLGPNGAGKTTTLRMMMGLISPTEGEIRVFGHRIRPGAPVLSRVGSFVEGSGFLPHLSGEQNLRLFWDATGRPADKAHFTEALEIAGLGDAVRRKVRTYSQGMRQRLAIAQAMLGLPELLVLDEPTNGLDPPQIHQMREVLQRYAATGRTVLVSSHLLAEVEQTCSHVVVMHRGQLVASGEVGEIVAAGGEATFRVDEPEQAAQALRAADGVSGVDIEGSLVHADLNGMPRAEAVAVLVKAGVGVSQAGPRRRLEDAFLQLVGEGTN